MLPSSFGWLFWLVVVGLFAVRAGASTIPTPALQTYVIPMDTTITRFLFNLTATHPHTHRAPLPTHPPDSGDGHAAWPHHFGARATGDHRV